MGGTTKCFGNHISTAEYNSAYDFISSKIVLENFSKGQVSFTLFFQGEKSKLDTALRSLQGLKLSQEYNLSFANSVYEWELNKGSIAPAI